MSVPRWDVVDIAVRLRAAGTNELAWALRRIASQAEARAIAATHRSWMVKSQGAADRCMERIDGHKSLAEAATAVADALDEARQGDGRSGKG